MNKEQVKKVLLDAVGNPETGVIADYADLLSQAVIDAFAEKKTETEIAKRELRIVKPEEIR